MSTAFRIGEKLLKAFASRLPERRIEIKGELYLRRWYVLGKMPDELADLWPPNQRPVERHGWLPTTYLHCFHLPDADRALHNHPWVGRGLILLGGYVEERSAGHPREGRAPYFRAMRPGALQLVEPDTFHRVTDLFEDRAWTLFVVGERVTEWGYWCKDRFVPHKERHADPNRDDGVDW